MKDLGISITIVEWDGIVRDVLLIISILTFLLNLYFIFGGWARRVKTGNPDQFTKAAFMTSVSAAFIVLLLVTLMLSRALHDAVRVGPSMAAVSMLWNTTAGYLRAVAFSLPSIAFGIVGGMALKGKR